MSIGNAGFVEVKTCKSSVKPVACTITPGSTDFPKLSIKYLIKLKPMKFKPLLFVVTLVALLAFQSKVVIPYLYEIAASDFFLEDTGDEANRLSSSNLMTNTAFNQCNNYIANEVLPDHTIKFAKNPINAFSLGSFSYVINADLDIQPADSASFTRRYVCRIKYHGDDSTGSTAPEDWSIDGFSGLDNI